MSPKDNAASNNRSVIYGVTLAVIAFLAALASSSFELRSYFTTKILQRQVLGKIFQKYNFTDHIILKIKTENGIEIEIYEKDPVHFSQRLKQRFSFPNDKDAYLMVGGKSVSLGLTDVDQDGVLDIVVPTVDPLGASRLNVFKFNSDINQFMPSNVDAQD